MEELTNHRWEAVHILPNGTMKRRGKHVMQIARAPTAGLSLRGKDFTTSLPEDIVGPGQIRFPISASLKQDSGHPNELRATCADAFTRRAFTPDVGIKVAGYVLRLPCHCLFSNALSKSSG
jgi:hypothetical protein